VLIAFEINRDFYPVADVLGDRAARSVVEKAMLLGQLPEITAAQPR
jgi:hypothetical protein